MAVRVKGGVIRGGTRAYGGDGSYLYRPTERNR